MAITFTFQYGQIYYSIFLLSVSASKLIYIPIWLDLLYQQEQQAQQQVLHLHSNMVRFIIKSKSQQTKVKRGFTFQYGQIYYFYHFIFSPKIFLFTFQYGQIYYIRNARTHARIIKHLHSNMVRFIIPVLGEPQAIPIRFTFQYGQIYYLARQRTHESARAHLHSNMVRFIIIKEA